MSKLVFFEKAWEEYLYWQMQDKKTLKRINVLLQDINRNPHRLVYKFSDNKIEIYQCKGHYND